MNRTLIAVVALVAIVSAAGAYHWSAVSELQAALVTSQGETAAAREAKGIAEANVAELQRQLEEQSAAVAKLASKAKQWEAAARARAAELSLAAERERRAVATMPGTGPDVMNRWFTEQFAPQGETP